MTSVKNLRKQTKRNISGNFHRLVARYQRSEVQRCHSLSHRRGIQVMPLTFGEWLQRQGKR